MKNMEYSRLIESYLKDLMQELPAIAIEGLKGVGKTVSAERLANTVFELDQTRDRELVQNDPTVLSTGEIPVLIDEWQKVPPVWDYVRRQVDRAFAPGSYLLTGSVANENLDIHSGAGRILRLKMHPLSLQERSIEKPTVLLSALLSQEHPFSCHVHGNTRISFSEYINEVTASGLPGIRRYSAPRRKQMIGTYLDYLLSHEFEQQGIRIRQPHTLLRWLRAYGAATSSDTGYNEILDASTAGEGDKPSSKTTISYREALGNLWLIEELPMWLEGESYFARLKRTPKHYLADPAFAAYLLGYDSDLLTRPAPGTTAPHTKFDEKYGSITGRLFESLVHLSLLTYATVNEAKLSFLKTSNADREIDFIVQRGQSVVAIESKMSPVVDEGDVKNLLWLKSRLGNALKDAIILTTGPVAYRMPSGIAVVPAALLGA